MALTVGFDLDMTLIDPRPGMALAMDLLAEETGFALDGARFAANLGPPLDLVLAEFGVPEDRVPELVARFRATYPERVIPRTVPLAGAGAALAAVRAAGGRVIVVTGKFGRNAELHLAEYDWPVDVVIGTLWAAGKAEALRDHDAAVYVGDHIGDVLGARAAAAVSVGVTTGPCTAAELTEAGADTVLGDLTEFPRWLADYRDR